MATANASPTEINDTFFLESACTVDRDAGVIQNVRILGRESKNGRQYSDNAMSEAAQLYEGKRCNYDHPPKNAARAERKFGEFAGVLENCRHDRRLGEVRGDFRVALAHPHAGLLMESAEKFPKTFGLSHNADGEVKHRNGTQIVEGLSHVESVDIVTRPATNQGLFESESEGTKMAKKTVKQILEDTPEDTKHRQLLLEIDGAEEAEVDIPAEASPEEQIKAGLMAAVQTKLADADESALQKILRILGIDNKLTAAMGNGGGGDADAGDGADDSEGGDEDEMPESQKIKELTDKLALIEAKNALLESGREATDERVEAVALIAPDKRAKLIESWPKSGGGARPGSSPPKHANESEDDAELKEIQESWNARLDKARKLAV